MHSTEPCYGWTLGEALAGDSLEGQFVSRLFNSLLGPLRCAVTDEVLAVNLLRMRRS